MNIFTWGLKKNTGISNPSELPEIFPFSVRKDVFTYADITATYLKILTDTVERTHGLPKKYYPLLWDNCVQDSTQFGLIHLLADAMTKKNDLFLVYIPSTNILRKATSQEQQQIKLDYEKSARSDVGVFISFKNYRRSDMLFIYSELEHCILSSLHKNLSLARAIQLKMSKLRENVALNDSAMVQAQAREIATALNLGKDIYLDKLDDIMTATPDSTAAEKAIAFLDAKRAFILGLPLSYISGLQSGGIGATGEADTRAIEQGLRLYFLTIIQPTIKALFDVDVEFKSQDFRQLSVALEMLKTFDLVSNDFMSREAKIEVTQRVFDLDPSEEKAALKKEAKETVKVLPAPPVNQNKEVVVDA